MTKKRNIPELPFKRSAQPVAVQKALRNFETRYGVRNGQRIFLAKAEELGTGNTMRQKVLSVYSKGAKLS